MRLACSVLHGGPGADHAYLLPQLLALTPEYELVFYDQRGGGRSKEAGADEDHMEDARRRFARVAAELAIDPLSIVGYSWGGLLALLYAVEASRGRATPASARLALIDPAPVSSAYRARSKPSSRGASRDPPSGSCGRTRGIRLKELDPDRYRQRAFELSVAGYFADPARAADLSPFRVVGRVQQSVWDSLGEFDLTADLATVHCPSLVVHGRQIHPAPELRVARPIAACGARGAG